MSLDRWWQVSGMLWFIFLVFSMQNFTYHFLWAVNYIRFLGFLCGGTSGWRKHEGASTLRFRRSLLKWLWLQLRCSSTYILWQITAPRTSWQVLPLALQTSVILRVLLLVIINIPTQITIHMLNRLIRRIQANFWALSSTLCPLLTPLSLAIFRNILNWFVI